MRTGVADLPLHYGSCPRWLFERMVKLSRAISEIIIHEYGKDEFLVRISDPFFFQSFACAIGFDYHSSGSSTITLGALKSANLEDFGIAVLGGKGRASRKTPQEMERLIQIFPLSIKEIEKLKYASKMSGKIDNACIQDGYQLYHHSFIVSEDGKWATIQQGMRPDIQYARRYHWLSKKVKSFVVEPHLAICCDIKGNEVLNMVAKESEDARKTSVDLVKDNPTHLKKYFTSHKLFKYLHMSPQHEIELKNYKPLMQAFELQPKNYEQLIAIKGIGPKTVRALALLSQLIFGAELSFRDPTTFAFCLGGKDGVPYRISTKVYDATISILNDAIKNAEIGRNEKLTAIKRLSDFVEKLL